MDFGLRITDVRIHHTDPENGFLRARASIELNGVLAVDGLKVIEGPRGLFVSMPARRNRKGEFEDIAGPIHPEYRQYLEKVVLAAYRGEEWREGDAGCFAPIFPPPDHLAGNLARGVPDRKETA